MCSVKNEQPLKSTYFLNDILMKSTTIKLFIPNSDAFIYHSGSNKVFKLRLAIQTLKIEEILSSNTHSMNWIYLKLQC